jgi:tRNA U38,U39,U40 pseudouridine synthase TruA
MLGYVTRSRRNLNSVNIEELEQMFVPFDITPGRFTWQMISLIVIFIVHSNYHRNYSMLWQAFKLDMYDIPCDNDDYAEFLKTLYAGSGQNQR